MKRSIMLGNRVRDRVTGFVGIATSIWTTITGKTSYGVEIAHNFNKEATGKTEHEESWFDEDRLEYVGDGVVERGSIGTEALTSHPPFNAMSEDQGSFRASAGQLSMSQVGTNAPTNKSYEQAVKEARAAVESA